MAQDATLSGLRNQLLTQIHGRRLALDPLDFLVGPRGVRKPITALTTAAGVLNDTIPNYGIVTINSSAASTYWGTTFPYPGADVKIFQISTLYAAVTIRVNGSTAASPTAGVTAYYAGSSVAGAATSATIFTLTNPGAWLHLTGLTTATWFAQMNSGSTVTTGSSGS